MLLVDELLRRMREIDDALEQLKLELAQKAAESRARWARIEAKRKERDHE